MDFAEFFASILGKKCIFVHEMDKILRVRHVNDYARYYSLQLSTSATTTNSDLLPRFEALLRKYYDDGLQRQLGQPNYFGDLFRQMTGDNASSAIRRSPPSHTSAATAPSTLASRPATTAAASSRGKVKTIKLKIES